MASEQGSHYRLKKPMIIHLCVTRPGTNINKNDVLVNIHVRLTKHYAVYVL